MKKEWHKALDVNLRKGATHDGVNSAFLAVKRDNLPMLKLLESHHADLDAWFSLPGGV